MFESNAPLKAPLKSSIDYTDGMDLDNADHLVAAVGASERSRRLPFKLPNRIDSSRGGGAKAFLHFEAMDGRGQTA